MKNQIFWIYIVLSVVYGFLVTFFASNIYYKAIQRNIAQKKIFSWFQVCFPVISAVLLFLPGLIHLIYWIVSFVTSIVTVAGLLIWLKIQSKKRDVIS
jgi:hypothetical protein